MAGVRAPECETGGTAEVKRMKLCSVAHERVSAFIPTLPGTVLIEQTLKPVVSPSVSSASIITSGDSRGQE